MEPNLHDDIEAARRLADKGALVGFYFHPTDPDAGWGAGLPVVHRKMQRLFTPDEVALVSWVLL